MYIYQADVYCDDCGQIIENDLLSAGYDSAPIYWDSSDWDEVLEHDGNASAAGVYADSDDWPCGPYSEDSEGDTPQHCGAGEECPNSEILSDGSKVGALLGPDSLTPEGVKYVRDAIAEALIGANSSHASVALEVWRGAFASQDIEPKGVAERHHNNPYDLCEGVEATALRWERDVAGWDMLLGDCEECGNAVKVTFISTIRSVET